VNKIKSIKPIALKIMKTIYVILICGLLFSKILIAQTKVCYSYDKAGNRTDHTICLKSVEATSDSVSEAKTPITENLGEMEITLFPNPTKGQVTVKITNMPDNIHGEITLHDLTGRLIIKQNSIQESNLLDLSAKQLGIYVLRIRDGDKVSEWKVIKE
jgi:hypothetical protein